jgi:cytoskeletal protein CcmA (bactofilin family)
MALDESKGHEMLNFSRNDRFVEVKDPGKPAVNPARTSAVPPVQQHSGSASPMTSRPSSPASSPAPAPARDIQKEPAVTVPDPKAAPSHPEMAGSKLFVGVNIKLKGIEISNCDVLVIEGQVEATINSKVMEIGKPGTLTGTAMIDVAEIHGEFSGELTARTKLVVHGTGRVTGTVRYGKLVVIEGGTLKGELQQIDAPADEARTQASTSPAETHAQASTSPAETRTQAPASPTETRTHTPAHSPETRATPPHPPRQAHL